MIILTRFVQLLEWLETWQAFFEFLNQPIVISVAIALCLYTHMLLLGADLLTATASASVVGAIFVLFKNRT